MNISEIRKKFPEYSDVSDGQLVRGLHKKFYADVPYASFLKSIDFREAVDPAADMSGGQQFLAGAGQRLTDIATLGGAVPILPRADEQANRQLMDTGAGMAGGVVADLATTLIPAVKGAQALQATRVMAPLGKVGGSLASNAIVAGGIGAATNPGGVSDRLQTGAIDAGLSAGGELATRGLARVVGGPLSASSVTPEAKRLIDEGVPVPPWKSTDSPRLRDLGERAKVSMLGKPILNDAERTAFTEWNRNLVVKASPPMPVTDESGGVVRWALDKPVKEVSDNSLNLLRGRFNEAYDALYKGRVIPLDDGFRSEVSSTVESVKRYYPQFSGEVSGIVAKVDDMLGSVKATTETTKAASPIVEATRKQLFGPQTTTNLGHAGVTPGALREALETVEDSITSAYRQGNGEKAEALQPIADALRGVRERGLPPEVQSMAKSVNMAYTNFLQLQKAHAMMGAQKAGLVTPQQVLSAMKSLDRSKGKAAFARGNVPNQSDVLNAARVMGSTLPEVGPGTAEKALLAGALASPSLLMGDLLTAGAAASMVTPTGQRYMFGQIPGQARAAGILRGSAPYVAQTAGILGNNQ